jgi:hypothetical protein
MSQAVRVSKIAVNCNLDRGLLGLVEKVNINQTSDFLRMAGMNSV